jgi:hypothetical protein
MGLHLHGYARTAHTLATTVAINAHLARTRNNLGLTATSYVARGKTGKIDREDVDKRDKIKEVTSESPLLF